MGGKKLLGGREIEQGLEKSRQGAMGQPGVIAKKEVLQFTPLYGLKDKPLQHAFRGKHPLSHGLQVYGAKAAYGVAYTTSEAQVLCDPGPFSAVGYIIRGPGRYHLDDIDGAGLLAFTAACTLLLIAGGNIVRGNYF